VDYLQRVRAAAQRMGELIDDLLELSRVGRTELRRTRINLADVAREVVADLRKRADRAVEFSADDVLPADADRRLMQVVLENLIGNAWKFTANTPAARVVLGAAPRDSEKVYFVRDNGAGFDMAYVDKLFRPFQRLHAEADFPGTGIGLATVHRIIERHGGRIWAEGEVGRGTTIFFTLPDARSTGTC
jgi:signal transduction histidine kinase